MESLDIGLLVLRVVIGALLVGHGSQKLFGWFGGPGLRGMAGHLEHMGYRPGLPFALLAAVAETAGGLLLALGLATPLAAALLTATMVNAYAAHAGKGVWAQNGGWEYLLVLGVAAAALDLTGPGAWSLDAALGLAPWNAAWVVGGLVAGLAGGLFFLFLRGLRQPSHVERRQTADA